MAIPDEDVAKVREATDISAVISEYTTLKRVGRRFVGLCPFHGEKTPSFSVNAEEGLYYCFGCQASGDAISFVRQIEHCDFVEAVERLASRAGISIRNERDAASEQTHRRREALYSALGAAAEFYHHFLLESPAAGAARRYLRSRGYDGDVVRRFQLGFSPPGFDALSRAARIERSVLVEAGLAFENRRGRLQDVMRERVIFPIFDPMGRTIALGGRILPDGLRTDRNNPGPKYRNSPESAIYQKSATLYGLNWSKSDIARSDEIIVCEGYTDVIGFFSAGLERAVATCGTSLTESHFRLISRFAKRIVLCYDQDNAGQNATARLYEFERRHEVQLFVATLPVGTDPGELARDDPQALRRAVAEARPFLGFRVDRALRASDLSFPEGRSRAAAAALAAVAEHPDSLVRDQYLIEIADRTHTDPARLRELIEKATASDLEHESSARPPRPVNDESGPSPRTRREPDASRSRAGRDALVLAIHRPDEVVAWIDEVLFTDPLQVSALRALASAAELHEAIAEAPPEVQDLLRRLAVLDDADRLDPDGTLIELVRSAAARALRDLEAQARRSGEDPGALADIVTQLSWLKAELEALRDPPEWSPVQSGATTSAHRILDWLRRAGQPKG